MATLTPNELADRLMDAANEDIRLSLMQRVVLTVERNVKKVTRVDTGRLRQSWASKVERAGERGRVGTTISYAPFQKNKPLEEGLDDSRSEISRILDEAGQEIIARIAG